MLNLCTSFKFLVYSYIVREEKMSIKCEKCGKYVIPVFKIDEGINSRVCPECGNIIDACTDNLQVIGRDM